MYHTLDFLTLKNHQFSNLFLKENGTSLDHGPNDHCEIPGLSGQNDHSPYLVWTMVQAGFSFKGKNTQHILK
jgi:hypothetical protein